MAENSPTFQRWVREFRGAQVPEGRLLCEVLNYVKFSQNEPDLRGFSRVHFT